LWENHSKTGQIWTYLRCFDDKPHFSPKIGGKVGKMGKKAKKTGQSLEKALPGDIRQRFVYILLFYAMPLGLKF
jgi:hypothetical protein